jgi:hypothetical protein
LIRLRASIFHPAIESRLVRQVAADIEGPGEELQVPTTQWQRQAMALLIGGVADIAVALT